MRVEALLFAQLADEIGPSIALDVAGTVGEATVADLRAAAAAAHPAIARLGRSLAVAVNEAYARDAEPVRPGDVVALLPPVAGG